MVAPENPGDVFIGPLLSERQLADPIEQPPTRYPPSWAGPTGGMFSPILRLPRPIPLPAPTGPNLPADRPPMPAQTAGNHGVGLAGFDPQHDLLPFGEGQSVFTW